MGTQAPVRLHIKPSYLGAGTDTAWFGQHFTEQIVVLMFPYDTFKIRAYRLDNNLARKLSHQVRDENCLVELTVVGRFSRATLDKQGREIERNLNWVSRNSFVLKGKLRFKVLLKQVATIDKLPKEGTDAITPADRGYTAALTAVDVCGAIP